MLIDILSGDFSLYTVMSSLLASLILIFLVSPLHELAHGFAAVKLGDNTPKWQGRMTLNPMAHIDYMGALMIILFGFGWAKPVQVNMYNFKNPKRDMAITAIAGPLSNFIVATIIGIFLAPVLVWSSGTDSAIPNIVFNLLYYLIVFNIYIGLFNLIPIAPLDGSRILSAVLPNKYYYAIMRLERYSFLIFVALFYVLNVGTVLSAIAGNYMNVLLSLSYKIFF